MTAEEVGDGPIEAYLDELVVRSSARRPRELRHLLAETEAHLRDDAARAVAEGRSELDADWEAVARFGPVSELVDADAHRSVTPYSVVVRQVFFSGLFLGGVGAVAVGLSGLVAAVIRLVAGSRALVDVLPGHQLTSSDCARWLALDPSAGSCRAAAVADWADETVFYRIAVGVLGVACLVGFRWLRKRRVATGSAVTVLPAVVTDTIGAALFGAAALGTLALGLEADSAQAWRGSGQWLSAASVAAVAAVVFGLRLLNDLRRPAG